MLLDDNVTSATAITGPKVWIQFELRGGDAPLEVDKFEVVPRGGSGGFPGRGGPQPAAQPQPGPWTFLASGSDDGQSWKELGQTGGSERPMGPGFRPAVQFYAPSRNRFYRVELTGPANTRWNFSEVFLFNKGARVKVGGPYTFTSAWMSAGHGRGVGVRRPRRALHVRPRRAALDPARRRGRLQVSDDAAAWTHRPGASAGRA